MIQGWKNLYQIGLSTFIFIGIMKVFIWLTTLRNSVTRNIQVWIRMKLNNLVKTSQVDFLIRRNTQKMWESVSVWFLIIYMCCSNVRAVSLIKLQDKNVLFQFLLFSRELWKVLLTKLYLIFPTWTLNSFLVLRWVLDMDKHC